MDYDISDMNFQNDERIRCKNKWYDKFRSDLMILEIDLYDHDDTLITATFPAKWQVCHICEGRGKHVNPSIDCNGLSKEDFDRDPDFMEEYLSGVYDITCNNCRGRNVEPVLAPEKFNSTHQYWYSLLEEHMRLEQLHQQEIEAERRMGC